MDRPKSALDDWDNFVSETEDPDWLKGIAPAYTGQQDLSVRSDLPIWRSPHMGIVHPDPLSGSDSDQLPSEFIAFYRGGPWNGRQYAVRENPLFIYVAALVPLIPSIAGSMEEGINPPLSCQKHIYRLYGQGDGTSRPRNHLIYQYQGREE